MVKATTGFDPLEARLNVLRETTGLLNYDAQTEEITRGYMRMLAGNAPSASREEARRMLTALGDHGGEFRNLTDLSNMFRDIYVKYGRIPMRRWAEPEDIAGPVYFLCSDDARYVTGQVLLVDGGASATF